MRWTILYSLAPTSPVIYLQRFVQFQMKFHFNKLLACFCVVPYCRRSQKLPDFLHFYKTFWPKTHRTGTTVIYRQKIISLLMYIYFFETKRKFYLLVKIEPPTFHINSFHLASKSAILINATPYCTHATYLSDYFFY